MLNENGQNYAVRYLTPTEYERLNGFPDGWTQHEQAEGHSYEQMGNSISVPVLEEIYKRITA
jgi:DNA (cytosine-5)-methyltransferase 1